MGSRCLIMLTTYRRQIASRKISSMHRANCRRSHSVAIAATIVLGAQVSIVPSLAQNANDSQRHVVIPRDMKVVLGVMFDMADASEADHQDGVRVQGVFPGGVADKSGIRPGDRILQFDNQVTDSPEALVEVLVRQNWGDSVSAIVWRNGKKRRLTINFK
jgi:S1-C subfamily serine protease